MFFNVICISVFLISCSSDEKTWNIANKNNDILSYEYYIEKYPKGKYTDKARYFINEIKYQNPPLISKIIPPIKLWNNTVIDTLILQISISAPQSKEYEAKIKSEYLSIIKEILKQIGITIVPNNIECKTKMIFNLQAAALSANYNYGNLYTGIKLTGQISLETDDEKSIKVIINENNPCPSTIYYTKIHQMSSAESSWRQSFGNINSDGAFDSEKEPEYIIEQYSPRTKQYLLDFFYKTWGASPILWLSKYLRNDPGQEEFNNEYEGDYSEELTNNIIRACCIVDYNKDNFITHEEQKLNNRAWEMILKENIHYKPKIIMPMILYNINKYGIFNTKKHKDNSTVIIRDLNLLKLIEKLGSSAIEVTPYLIKHLELSVKNNDYTQKKNTIALLNKITDENFDCYFKSWEIWWFKNKQLLLDY